MPDYNSAELARICRQQAAMTGHKETKEVLLKMAEKYDAEFEREERTEASPDSSRS